MRRQTLENMSTAMSMQVWLSDGGRSVIYSTPVWDHRHLGMGNGTNLPIQISDGGGLGNGINGTASNNHCKYDME